MRSGSVSSPAYGPDRMLLPSPPGVHLGTQTRGGGTVCVPDPSHPLRTVRTECSCQAHQESIWAPKRGAGAPYAFRIRLIPCVRSGPNAPAKPTRSPFGHPDEGRGHRMRSGSVSSSAYGTGRTPPRSGGGPKRLRHPLRMPDPERIRCPRPAAERSNDAQEDRSTPATLCVCRIRNGYGAPAPPPNAPGRTDDLLGLAMGLHRGRARRSPNPDHDPRDLGT